MDNAAYEATKARLLRLLTKWVGPLGLAHGWRVELRYERGGIRPDDAMHRRGEQALFEARANWRYLSATITAGMPEVEAAHDDDLEWAFVHELAHVLVNECRQMDKKDWLAHEERVCSTLANAFLGVEAAARARYEVPTEPGVPYGDRDDA